MFSFSRKAMQK